MKTYLSGQGNLLTGRLQLSWRGVELPSSWQPLHPLVLAGIHLMVRHPIMYRSEVSTFMLPINRETSQSGGNYGVESKLVFEYAHAEVGERMRVILDPYVCEYPRVRIAHQLWTISLFWGIFHLCETYLLTQIVNAVVCSHIIALHHSQDRGMYGPR